MRPGDRQPRRPLLPMPGPGRRAAASRKMKGSAGGRREKLLGSRKAQPDHGKLSAKQGAQLRWRSWRGCWARRWGCAPAEYEARGMGICMVPTATCRPLDLPPPCIPPPPSLPYRCTARSVRTPASFFLYSAQSRDLRLWARVKSAELEGLWTQGLPRTEGSGRQWRGEGVSLDLAILVEDWATKDGHPCRPSPIGRVRGALPPRETW